MQSLKAIRTLVGFGLLSLVIGACQAVAGIEDRTLDPDFGKPSASTQCQDYCTTVMDACTGDDAVYTTVEICLGVCAKLDPGDPEDTHNNTVACRAFYANDAKRERDSCRAAGPGGNGVCGSDCEAYCQLYPAICPNDYKYGDTENCLTFCNALPQHETFDVVTDHDGDSVECRLVHTSSSTTKPKEHCAHAQIPPTDYCSGLPDAEPNCEDYCRIQLAACDGDLKQYESRDQCLAVCGALDLGTNEDEAGNNIGCRRYHAFSASTTPLTHCYHSGPTGDGHCGDHAKVSEGHTGNCESYCHLLKAACESEFDNVMVDDEGCMKACIDLPEAEPDSKFTLASAEESTGLSCRILYTARALTDKSACASAIGNDRCQ